MESSKNKKNNNSCDEQQLGMDQLFEIVSWLPAKAAIKFSSLSKSLYRFLTVPSFVERQMVRSSVIDGGFFIKHRDPIHQQLGAKPGFHVLPGGSPSTGIPLTSMLETSCVLASSQGLLLLYKMENLYDMNYSQDFILICNPATRRYASVPLPEWLGSNNCSLYQSILECHPRNDDTDHPQYDDYSVITPVIMTDNDLDQLVVYSKGKWELHTLDLSVEERYVELYEPAVCLFRGGIVIHYMSYSCRWAADSMEEPYLAAYDVGTKAFSRRLKLPEGSWEDIRYSGANRKIFKWKRSNGGETIGIVRIHGKGREFTELMFTVWVLEDYENGSWRRVVQKTMAEMGVPQGESLVNGSYVVVNGTGLVFATKGRVFLYHMEGAHSGRLEVVGENKYDGALAFVLYANTLRPVYAGESQVLTF